MTKKTLNTILYFVTVLLLTTSVLAQDNGPPSKKASTNSYIILLADDSIIQYKGNVAGYEATKPEMGKKLSATSAKVQNYRKLLKSKHNKSLQDAGVSLTAKVHDYVYAMNGYSAILTEDEAAAIKSQKGVLMVMEDHMRYAQTDSSGKFLGLTKKGGAYASGYTGEDVVVGIIDTGIWPEHPSFADDGSYGPSPISPLDGTLYPTCDFGNTAHNLDDVAFTCNNKLLGARQVMPTYRALIGADPDEFDSARDDDGHGTHTASTAAGNAGVEASMYGMPVGTISGIAPRARVIAYKGLGNLGGFGSDLAAAIDQAVLDGVDVINYSVGGGASLTGADDIAFLFVENAGVFAAASAGNSGPGAATIGGPASVPWITTVGANTQTRFLGGTVNLAKDGKKSKKSKKSKGPYRGATITAGTKMVPLVDAADHGNELCLSGLPFTGDVSGKIVLCRRGAVARTSKSLAVFLAGGTGMILYNNSDDDNLFTDSHWVPTIHIDYTPGTEIKDYIASVPEPKAKLKTGKTSKWKNAPTMAYFSSRGPNPVAADIIKPDITAPGHQILAGNSPFPDPGSTPPGELFQAISGTSMSSPHIAGIFALLKQAHPGWSASAAKSALMTTASQHVRDNDRKSKAQPFAMGAGQADPGGKWTKKGSINQPGLVYEAGLFEYAAFTCGMDLGVFTPGTCTFLSGLGIPLEPYNLNVPSIGVADVPGRRTVIRTVSNVASETVNYKAKIRKPKGFKVYVTPNQLILNPGDSATFEVTFTNDKAPVGEWAFGSLTWKGGGYEVYSPIAVKPSLFGAPPVAMGSGASGTASFDVNFGYTGTYTAAPHGLVAPILSSDSIGQDPDQTYPSGDDSAVGVQKWPFVVSGAGFLRIELVIPGPDDIDLFLENSSGTIIAASTSGGTDELIELVFPADDTYTLVVHGWSVPSAPLAYTLSTWIVPLAPGGSLTVDSAPASAVLGTIGTVDIGWSGLSAGTRYLGAVSHTGDAGLLDATLVEVDVP